MTEIIIRVVPILLLLLLGNIIRVRGILSPGTVEELKGLVVNIALPAVLFLAFLEMRMERAFLGLFLLILLICLVMFLYGFILRRALAVPFAYYPFLMTGFEFGMVGISLFGSAYGLANVGYIAIVDLSHELFIWFVFVTILTARRDGVSNVKGTLKGFARSPLILAIVTAVVLNVAGLGESFRIWPVTAAVAETFGLLGNVLIPVILIIIGFGMGLSLQGIRSAATVVVTRLVVLLPLAFLVSRVVVRDMLALEPAFEAAVFTFLILPPPYIIPLFMKRDDVEERTYANNVLSVYTLVSLAIFIVYFVFNPALG
ncbi:MAG: hypothetical protein EA427_08610 [Spirochaetaceae bacterium]|nr:MAG: hypothetical protein EA427_08610 [Spirochaetaceae bacterium]